MRVIPLLFLSQFSFAASLSSPITTTGGGSGVASITTSHRCFYSMDAQPATGTLTLMDGTTFIQQGVIQGNPITVVGISSNALSFDGVFDFVNVAVPPIKTSAGTDYVVYEAFVKISGAQVVATLYRKTIMGMDTTTNFMLYIDSRTNFLGVYFGSLTSQVLDAGGIELTSGPAINDGKFHYVAFAKRGGSGNDLELWLDGNIIAKGNMSSSYNNGAGGTSRIGAQNSSDELSGIVDEAGWILGPNSTNIPSAADMVDRSNRFSAASTIAAGINTSRRMIQTVSGSAVR